MQDDSSMPPVLVREDVIGEFMESCKKEEKKKPRCLTTYSKLPSVLLSYRMQKHQSVPWGGSPTTTTL